MEVRPSRSQENQEICPGQQIASPGVCCLLGEVEVVRIGGQFDAPEERGTRGGFRFGPPSHVSELSHKSGRTVHMLISISISISRFYFILFYFISLYFLPFSKYTSVPFHSRRPGKGHTFIRSGQSVRQRSTPPPRSFTSSRTNFESWTFSGWMSIGCIVRLSQCGLHQQPRYPCAGGRRSLIKIAVANQIVAARCIG
jgi:hypothetical protein